MKHKARKALSTKLLTEFESVVRRNKITLSNKIEKNLKKSIRKIVKKADVEKVTVSTGKRKPVLKLDKSKMDGVPVANSTQTAN